MHFSDKAGTFFRPKGAFVQGDEEKEVQTKFSKLAISAKSAAKSAAKDPLLYLGHQKPNDSFLLKFEA